MDAPLTEPRGGKFVVWGKSRIVEGSLTYRRRECKTNCIPEGGSSMGKKTRLGKSSGPYDFGESRIPEFFLQGGSEGIIKNLLGE